MRKSLLVTQDFLPSHGGVAKYYAQICAGFDSDQIVVLAPPVSIPESDSEVFSYPVIRRSFFSTRSWVWPRWLPLIFWVVRLARQTQVGVIQVGQVLPVGMAVYLAAKILRLPYLVYAHGLDVQLPQGSARKKKSMMRVLRSASAIVTNSEYTKREIVRLGIDIKKISVITPGCDLIDVSTDQGLLEEAKRIWRSPQRFILLTVSRLEERKGHDLVIEACQRLRSEIPELTYLIVGDGPFRSRLEERVSKADLSRVVHFIGSVSPAQLRTYYQIADIFVMPARQLANRDVEGFGIVYLEANAFGKAVIGGRSGGVAEAVRDGETGLLVNPTDLDDLVNAIRRLYRDPELRRRLGEAGRSRVRSEFRWQQRSQQIHSLVESL